jgi:hypothetical protein
MASKLEHLGFLFTQYLGRCFHVLNVVSNPAEIMTETIGASLYSSVILPSIFLVNVKHVPGEILGVAMTSSAWWESIKVFPGSKKLLVAGLS